MVYIVEWEELVFDLFDELEAVNPQNDFSVQADSFESANSLAGTEAIRRLSEIRVRSTYSSFVPSILSLTDENGVKKRVTPERHII